MLSHRLKHEKYLKYKTIIDAASEGILEVRKTREISVINASAQELLGVQEANILGISRGTLWRKMKALDLVEKNNPSG